MKLSDSDRVYENILLFMIIKYNSLIMIASNY